MWTPELTQRTMVSKEHSERIAKHLFGFKANSLCIGQSFFAQRGSGHSTTTSQTSNCTPSYEGQLRDKRKKQADLQKQNVAAGDESRPAVLMPAQTASLPKLWKNKSGRLENVKQVHFRINRNT